MSLLDDLKEANPALAKFSDEDLLKAAHKVMGGKLEDVADEIGYSTPSSMMGKELYAGGNRYLAGMGHIGAAMGIPGAADYTKRKEERADALQGMSTAPHSWDEMKFGDPEKGVLPYVGQLAAGSAPYMAEAAGYGLADAATGGALTPEIASIYAARAARAGVSLPEFLGGQGLRAGASFPARRAAIQAADKAAPGLARTAMLPVATYPSSLGDVLGNQQEEAGRYNLPQAAAAAVPYSMLNVLGLEGAITKGGLPRLGIKGLEKNAFGRAASGVLATGGSEAFNETGQEVANQYGRMGVNPNATLTDPAALARYKESAIGGAILGGLPGSLHAFGGHKPLDTKQPTDLLNPGKSSYADMVEASMGMKPGSMTPYTPQQQAAANAARAASTQDAAAKDFWERMHPPAAPAYGDDYAAMFEASQGLAPGATSAPPPPPGGQKAKAAANAARDATATTLSPEAEQIRDTKMALAPLYVASHLPADHTKTPGQIHQAITRIVGDPKTQEEAADSVLDEIVATLTPGQGKGSKAERAIKAGKLIQFRDAILKTPLDQRLTVDQWEDKIKAESAAAAVAKARTDAKVGQAAKLPGDVVSVDPATLNAAPTPAATPITPATAAPTPAPAAPAAGAPAFTEVPAKPKTPAEVAAYKLAVAPRLVEGLLDSKGEPAEDLQALLLTRGKESVTDEGTAVSMPSPEHVARLQKTPEGRKKLAALVAKMAEAAELGTGETAPKKNSLRRAAHTLGLRHSTVQGMVNRALKRIRENAAALGLDEDTAHEMLDLQSSHDVIDSGVRGTGAGGTYEGGQRVNVDEREEGVTDARGERAAEVTTEEGPPEEGPAEEGEAAPVAAKGEDTAEAKLPARFASGKVDHLGIPLKLEDAEAARQEWEDGRGDDDPAWDQLPDTLQTAWIKGVVASEDVATMKFGKPKESKQRAIELMKQLGLRRAAVMEGVEEHGLRQPDDEAEAGADDAGGAGAGGPEPSGVSGRVPGDGAGAVQAAAPERAEGEAGAAPAVAGETGKVAEAAEPVVRRKRKVAGGKAELVQVGGEEAAPAAPAAPTTEAKQEEPPPAPTTVVAAQDAETNAEADAAEAAEAASLPSKPKRTRKAAPAEAAAPAEPKPKRTRKKAAPVVSEAAGRTVRLNRARRQWLDAFSQEPLVGKWDELSKESQEEFIAANDDEQALADVISIKVGDASGEAMRNALEARKQEKAEAAKPKEKPVVSPAEGWGKLHALVPDLGSWNDLTTAGQQEFAALDDKARNVGNAQQMKLKDNRWKALSAEGKAQKAAAAAAAATTTTTPEATQEQLQGGVDKLTGPEQQKLADFYGTKVGTKKFFSKLAADVAKATNEGIEKVAAAIRAIVAKVATGVLSVGIVFNPMVFETPQANARPFAYDLPAAITTTISETTDIRANIPHVARNKMSQRAQQVYEAMAPQAMESGKAFIIADKVNGMLHAFHADGTVMAQAPALYGKDVGDVEVGNSLKGGAKITPAGQFTLVAETDSDYAGGVVYTLKETKGAEGSIAVHAVWLGEPKERRAQRLASPDPVQHRISYGCINTSNDTFLKDLLPHSSELTGGPIFVLPDEVGKTAEMFPVRTETKTETYTSEPGNATADTRGGTERNLPGREQDQTRVKRVAAKRREKSAALKKLLDSGDYVFHAVRSDEDIASIFEHGLKYGSNLSYDREGQAFEGEGDTVLVFRKDDVGARNKGYQNDGTVTKVGAKPVAILKDTSLETRDEVTKESLDKDGDEIATAWEEQHKLADGLARGAGIEKAAGDDNAGQTMLSMFDRVEGTRRDDRPALIRALKEQLGDFYDRAKEVHAEVERIYKRLDAFNNRFERGPKAGVTAESVLARYKEHGVPVHDLPQESDFDQMAAQSKSMTSAQLKARVQELHDQANDLQRQAGEHFQKKEYDEGHALNDRGTALHKVANRLNGLIGAQQEIEVLTGRENLSPEKQALAVELQEQQDQSVAEEEAKLSSRMDPKFDSATNPETGEVDRPDRPQAKTPTNVAHATKKLKRLFFSPTKFDQKVTIVQHPEDLAHLGEEYVETARNAAGFHRRTDGHIFLIGDNIEKGGELSVFLHESSHAGLLKMIGLFRMKSLANQIEQWAAMDDDSTKVRLAKAVMAQVEDAMAGYGPQATERNRREETVAYFITYAVDEGFVPGAIQRGVRKEDSAIAKWIDSVWQAMKEGLRRMGLYRFDTLSPQEIVDLVYGAAQLHLNRGTQNAQRYTRVGLDLGGDFDLQHAGTATAGAPPRTAKATATKHIDNVEDFAKRHGLGFMITNDIADLAASNGFPEVRTYVNAAQNREGERAKFEEPVSRIAEQYDALPQKERGIDEGSVNKFIHDATLRGDLSGIASFSAAGQKLIRDVFKHGSDTLALKKRLIEEQVGKEYDQRIAEETTEAKKDEVRKEKALMLRRYSKLMTVPNSDTYAPLKRFGDYVVSAKSAEFIAAEEAGDKEWLSANESDPNHRRVEFAESQGEANAIKANLGAQFTGGELYASARDADIHEHHDLFRAFPVLQTRLAAEYPMEGGKPSPMARIIRDLYLQALAENHARKNELRRRGIAGASPNMIRAFVTQGRADASHLANLKHNDALQAAVQGMRQGAKRDRARYMLYVNEMLQRHAAGYETQSADLANKIKRTTSLWLLATNPTYYLQQLVQPWSMSLPVIAGSHGYFRTARALSTAYSDITALVKGTNLTGHIDWDKAPADVRDMLNALAHNGAIDVTNTMDQGEWETAGKSRAGAAWNQIDRKLRGLNTRVEALNRSTTAMAAYRMEMARNGGDKAKATRYAEDMVRQTHGSYDGSNTPRYLQGSVKGLLTQFRRFQIIQIAMITRLFHNAFKGATATERGIARRALAYTLLHTGAIGGVLGMPGAAAITTLIAKLFGPDGEPPDFEKEARELIGDQTIADLLLNGVPAMLGINASPKFGMGNMLSVNAFADFPHDAKSFDQYVAGSLGPFVGLTRKAIDGVALIYKGDVARGTEQLLPSGFANAMKGYRYATEGVTLRKGDVVLSPEDIGFFDATMQGLGLPTTTITNQQRLSQTKYEFDTYYKDRAAELINDFQQARKDGDSTADVISEWQSLQEGRVRNGYTRQPMSLLIKSAQQQAKRERSTAGGVEFSKANKRFVQEQANL